MPKYLLNVNYVGEGIKGLVEEGGTSRRAVAEQAVLSVGGTMEAFYYAFGATDAYVIVDLPDNVTAAGVALRIGATGRVTIHTTVLITAEELDEAVKVSPNYRRVGQ